MADRNNSSDKQDDAAKDKKVRVVTQVVTYNEPGKPSLPIGSVIEVSPSEASHLINVKHARLEGADPDALLVSNQFAHRNDTTLPAPLPVAPAFDDKIGEGGKSKANP